MTALLSTDPDIYGLIASETLRQARGIELIASENFVSKAIMEAVGSVLTNKYAEGYPGHRYYGGCQFHDSVERLAIDRAKELFGAGHANLQPHCGANANLAAYMACVNIGDTIMAMRLDHGGHLSHGAKFNFSGKFYNVVSYGVDRESGRINYDEVARIAQETSPKLIIAGASAYARFIDFARFAEIAQSVGAIFLVDMAHIAGLVAAKVHPSPVQFADVVTTTTHKTLRGPRGGMILCKEAFAKKIDSAVFPGTQGGPLMHEIAGKAVCLKEAAGQDFVRYQKTVVENADTLAKHLLNLGFNLVSGGTDNHLILVDLKSKGLTGTEAEAVLGKIDVVVNKNMIPFDEKPAGITSGIRLGTPAISTRGMKPKEMATIAEFIDRALQAKNNETELGNIRGQVIRFAEQFPIY